MEYKKQGKNQLIGKVNAVPALEMRQKKKEKTKHQLTGETAEQKKE